MTTQPPFEGASLLPHSEHARFVVEVLNSDKDALVCIGRIPTSSPFARGGKFPGFVLIELVAQAAAIDTLTRMGDDGPRQHIGYLVRARELNWTANTLPSDTPLTVRVQRIDSMQPLFVYQATVKLEGAEVFSGTFGIYVDSDSS